MKDRLFIIAAGAVTGLLAVLLVLQGNPANMGFCIACFLRDITGGLGRTGPGRSSTCGRKLWGWFWALLSLP